jgi:SLT domain-containing protein
VTAPIDRAYVEILPDLRKFAPQMKTQVAQSMRGLSTTVGNEYQKTTKAVQGETTKMTRATKSVADESKRNLVSMGTAVGATLGLLGGTLIKSFITAATEQQKINRQTEAVIKSTGGSAHVTASQISELSGRLAEQTGIQDDVIQSGANMLLTFTNVRNEVGKGNDIFNQAVSVVTDMSVALGQDTASSAIQLGKALNDPIKGVTALQRVGVTFTAQQKDQIKAMVANNDTLGAQKLILAELNKEFGGSAAAQATAAGKMSVAWDNFSEAMGNALLPALSAVFDILSQLINILGPFAPVLVGMAAAAGILAGSIWLVVKAKLAWVLVSNTLGKSMLALRANVMALAIANGLMATSMRGALVGLVGLAAPFLIAAGGAAALAVGAIALEKAIGGSGDAAQKAALGGIKDLDSALKDSNGVWDENAKKVLATTLVHAGFVDKAAQAGISAKDLTAGVIGSDAAFAGLIDRWKAGGDPSNQTITNLQRMHDHLLDDTKATQDNANAKGTSAVAQDQMATAIANTTQKTMEQTKFLLDNNLTVEQATAKYNDAVKEANSFTAQLGYMSEALDQVSNNAINTTLQQDQLNLTMGTAADNFAGARTQVSAHGTALVGNTGNAISNRDWVLQQIQAINQQGVSFAKSSGSVAQGTAVINTNTGALRLSMQQAGFTGAQIDTLINKYRATPEQIQTLVNQKGQEAVVAKLGEMVDMLHRIADPAWAAKVDFLAGNTSMPLAATGGLVGGNGQPTADDRVIRVSSGEYVVNAFDTSRNLEVLKAINNGIQVKGFAAGGLVGVPGIGNRNKIIGNLNNIMGNRGASQDLVGGPATLLIASDASQFYNIPGLEAKYVAALKKAMGPISVPGNFSGSVLSWVFAAENATGTPASWTAPLLRRINFESGGNPNAINNWDSNAAAGDPSRGLMQTIGSTFAAYHQPGTSNNIYDPVANIAAAINYIKSRYGSIFAIDPPVQGYGNGGPVNRTGLIFAHKGEEVLNNADAQKYRTQRGPMVVELGPRSIAAIAAAVTRMVIEMDGHQVATIVSKHQALAERKGARR